MKKTVLTIVMVISIFTIQINAQVGINTANPQGAFNIDAAKDNAATGVPTAAQQANDVSVTATGNVGIGITSPNEKLDVRGGITFTGQSALNKTAFGGIDYATSTVPAQTRILSWGPDAANDGIISFWTGLGGAATAEKMRIHSNGNVGIGTSAPASKLHIEGAEVRLTNATSLWGLDPEGTSPTSQFSIVNRTANVRHFILQENGNAYLGGSLSTGGGSATISTVGGSVGIGNNGAPTNTLDVNGTTRVRSMTSVAGATVVTPVYSDANGVLVKTSPAATYGGTSSNTVSVASNATGVLISGLVDGAIYKVMVITGDACGDTAIADFYLASVSGNSFFAINGLGGLLASGTTNKSPAFAQTGRAVIATTWTGKVGCSAGDNSTSLNYTLTVPGAGSINITNNGNITKSYSVMATRVN